MEHRCSERVATDQKVLIYKMGIPLAIGRLKNSSKLGFFVETDFADINILQPLDVEVLLYRGPQHLDRFKFTTRVIRKSDTGLGVELEYMSNESAQALDNLLHAARNNVQPVYQQSIHQHASQHQPGKPRPMSEQPLADMVKTATKIPKKMAQVN